MLRYLGRKGFITRDRSQRWMITRKGRGALVQNAFLTFRNVMQTIADPNVSRLLSPNIEAGGTDFQKEKVCMSIEPLKFPAFPSPVTKSRVKFLKHGKLYLIDLGIDVQSNEENRIEDLLYMQNHLNSLTADLNIIVGEFKDKFLCLNEDNELSLEIKEQEVHGILTHYLFSLLETPQIILDEMYQILKPGQSVILVEYTTENSLFQTYQKKLFSNGVPPILPPIYKKILDPLSPRTKETILDTIRKTPFEILEVIDVPNLPRFILKKQ